MARRETAIFVLDQMQELDQQVASARAVAEKNSDFVQRTVVERPTLGASIAAAPLLDFHSLSNAQALKAGSNRPGRQRSVRARRRSPARCARPGRRARPARTAGPPPRGETSRARTRHRR